MSTKMSALVVALMPLVYANPVRADDEKVNVQMEAEAQSQATHIFQGKYKARVHVRYHQARATWFKTAERIGTIVVLVFGAFAFSFPFVFRHGGQDKVPTMRKREYVWYAIGGVSFVASIFFTAMDYTARYSEHAVTAKRWNSLAAGWEKLEIQIADGSVSKNDFGRRIADLVDIGREIENAEPPEPNNELLAQCQREESRHLGLDQPE